MDNFIHDEPVEGSDHSQFCLPMTTREDMAEMMKNQVEMWNATTNCWGTRDIPKPEFKQHGTITQSSGADQQNPGVERTQQRKEAGVTRADSTETITDFIILCPGIYDPKEKPKTTKKIDISEILSGIYDSKLRPKLNEDVTDEEDPEEGSPTRKPNNVFAPGADNRYSDPDLWLLKELGSRS